MSLIISAEVMIDFNRSGIWGTTEDVTTDLKSFSWNRGSEPEQETSPGGSATFNFMDPNGDYVVGSTASKFGSTGALDVGLPVRARLTHNGSTYGAFRGLIEKISVNKDAAGAQIATIFCVDEMEQLSRNKISYPNSISSSGDVSHSTGRPLRGVTAGGSTGVIAQILNTSSFSSTRRAISQGGSTFENWWIHNEDARTGLQNVEKHSRGRVYIDGDGDLTFHSSTHRNNSTAVATFNANFDDIGFSVSSRDVINEAVITVHSRNDVTPEDGVLGFTNSTSLPTIANGSVFRTRIEFGGPAWTAIVPLAEANSTKGVSIVGVAGPNTTYTGASAPTAGTFIGASALLFQVTNNSGETVQIQRPANATDTSQTIPIEGITLNDRPFTSTSQDTASITTYGVKGVAKDLPYFATPGKASQYGDALVDSQSTAHAQGIRFHITGSDSDIITQILSRDLDDRIALTSTHFKWTSKNFYITAMEVNFGIAGGGDEIEATWTLGEAT